MMDTRTEYAMFGDSFVKMFGLIRHRKLQTIGYKGASAKGLGRSLNDDVNNKTSSSSSSSSNVSSRFAAAAAAHANNSSSSNSNNTARDIQYRLNRMTCLKECYFCFGQVDVHLSYYYKTYGKHEEIDLDSIARSYVDFVANLQLPHAPTRGGGSVTTTKKKTKTIVGIYPSAPDDDFVRQALVAYGSLTEEQSECIPPIDVMLQTRQDRVIRFNQILQEECLEKQINFVQIFDELCSVGGDIDSTTDKVNTTTDTDTTDSTSGNVVTCGGGVPRLKDAYRDISKCNIHLVWETTLLLWMRRLPWLSTLAPPGFEQQLQATFAEYAKTKPWAESNQQGGSGHVCQHLGMAAAVDM